LYYLLSLCWFAKKKSEYHITYKQSKHRKESIC
jgi:hypothetical protein